MGRSGGNLGDFYRSAADEARRRAGDADGAGSEVQTSGIARAVRGASPSRVVSIVVAEVYLLTTIAVGFVLVVAGLFPGENRSPEELASDDWLAWVGGAIALTGLAAAAAVIVRRPLGVSAAFLVQTVLAFVVLRYVLAESVHGDGWILLVAFVVELVGAATVAAAIVDDRPPR